MSGAHVSAVCVVRELIADLWGDLELTAIDKRPFHGPVRVTTLGLIGDQQFDTRFHGGIEQACYAYAAEDLAEWAVELGRELPPGSFGENFSTDGVDVTGARIGEKWAIGAAVVRVTAPRIPCRTFQGFLGEPHWIKRYTQRGKPGAYLAVEVEGVVSAGDEIEVVHRPDHDVTIADLYAVLSGDRERLARVAACADLTPTSHQKLAALLDGRSAD